MKKTLSKLLIFIGIIICIIINNQTISYGNYEPLYWFTFGTGLGTVANNNEERIFVYDNNSTKDIQSENLMIDAEDHVWIKGMHAMLEYINNNTAETIKNKNTKDSIEKALSVVDLLDDYLNDSEFIKQRGISNSFSKYTGFSLSSYSNYEEKYVLPAFFKLTAAKDSNEVRSLFNSSYEDLFKFNRDSINQYTYLYGNKLFPSRLSSTQRQNVEKVWQFKLGLYQSLYEKTNYGASGINLSPSVLTREDILVDIGDSFEKKMSYDQDHIRVYQGVWGNNLNLEGEEKRAVEIEWAYVSRTGEHTSYYKKEYKNGHVPYKTDENYNKTYLYYSKDDEKNAVENGWIEILYDVGEENEGTKADRTERKRNSNGDIVEEKEKEAKKNKVDTDANRIFKQPLNLGNSQKDNNINGAISDAEKLVDSSGETKEIFSEGDMADFSNSIYNILLSVGIVIAVIVGMILGVKLMLAPIGERAEAKKLLIPYAVGCAVIFGAFGIWKIAVILLQSV